MSRNPDPASRSGNTLSGTPHTLRGVLDGVDTIDWALLDRAYFSADDDVAGVLRAVGSADQETADEAFETLCGWITHQGSIYPTTVACLPFLVELAQSAHYNRAHLTFEVGYVADPDRTDGSAHDDIRAALTRSIGGIEVLLADDDAEVRKAAVYVRTLIADADRARVLRNRWAIEHDKEVRASLLIALGRAAPDAYYDEFAHTLMSGIPRLRLAAAVAIARAGLAWPPRSADVLARLIVDGVEIEPPWFLTERAVDKVVQQTLDAGFVREALSIAVVSEPPQSGPRPRFAPPIGAESVLYALHARCDVSRHAPQDLVELLGPLLANGSDEIRHHTVMYLGEIGSAALTHIDALVDIANQPPDTTPPRVPKSDFAIRALVRLGHPAWVDPLCNAWAAGRRIELASSICPMYRPLTQTSSMPSPVGSAPMPIRASSPDSRTSPRNPDPLIW